MCWGLHTTDTEDFFFPSLKSNFEVFPACLGKHKNVPACPSLWQAAFGGLWLPLCLSVLLVALQGTLLTLTTAQPAGAVKYYLWSLEVPRTSIPGNTGTSRGEAFHKTGILEKQALTKLICLELVLVQVAKGNKRKVTHAVFTLAMFAVCETFVVWRWTRQKQKKEKSIFCLFYRPHLSEGMCDRVLDILTHQPSGVCSTSVWSKLFFFLSNHVEGPRKHQFWLEASAKHFGYRL